MIPEDAVEAAKKIAYERYGSKPDAAYVRTILEAALPHLSEAARQPQRTSPTDWPDLPKARS